MLRFALFAVFLSACATAPPIPPLPEPLAAVPSGDLHTLDAPSLLGLAAVLDIVPAATGYARLVTGPTACQPVGGVNPYPVLPLEPPAVGRPLALTWSTRAGGYPAPPAESTWLLASYRPQPANVNFDSWGRGCVVVFAPDEIVTVTTTPGGRVWRDGGRTFFRWTPPASAAGLHFSLQLLTFAREQTSSGWLVSPTVEVVVGSAPVAGFAPPPAPWSGEVHDDSPPLPLLPAPPAGPPQ